MFENLSYSVLQHYWWILVAVLGSALIVMMFTLWGQAIYNRLGKTENEKTLILNALGKHYKLTFSILVTFGWAVFASFPIFYATSFGWAYLVWMAILFLMIVQAVAYEYRSKPNNFLGKKTYDIFLFLNWLLVPLLLWVAVATFFTGSNFEIENSRLVDAGATHHIITTWTTPFYGLEALWNTREWAFITNIALWVSVTLLVQILALLYIMHHIDNKTIINNARKCLIIKTIVFLIFFLTFVFKLFTISGVWYDALWFFIEKYKYLHNFLDSIITYFLFVWWAVLVLLGIWLWIFKKSRNAFWFSALWTFLFVISLFIIAGFNDTVFYPSLVDLNSSLTIENASSSYYSLIAMSYVSLMLPFVIAYIVWAWKTIASKPMKFTDLKKELESY